MDIIERNLKIIEECIQSNCYIEVETERFELKDLSRGWGEDWYKTVCAFLNTNGGIIVIGINDKNNAKPPMYKLTGYNNSDANEKHLQQELPKKFTDREGHLFTDIHNYFRFEIRNFLDKRIAIVYIEELAADEKYAFYEKKAYKRILTGDYELLQMQIEEYEEDKRNIINRQELTIIRDTPLEVLNIDTLNQYILKYNKGKKRGETIKANLETALSFLKRENFIRDNTPTLLGMLVCGNDVEKYLQGKSEADCYVIVPSEVQLAKSKEIINDNIIGLIESCFNFVWRNIQVGVSYSQGGKAEPEYSEALIRESINNAFAHRSYAVERFVIIEIRPNESLMICNPGKFEYKQRINLDTGTGKIKRIIPIQVAKNPTLTHLLKSFDYWEGKGRGLTSLIDACLANEIDVPYYSLTGDEIKLFIPRGKVLNDTMEIWFKSFSGYISAKMGRLLSQDEKIILSFFRKSEELNRLDKYTILLTMDNNHSEVIATLEEKGLLFKNKECVEKYEYHPVYQVDRTMMKKDFSDELKRIFSNKWNELKPDYQEVLNAIYWHNQYGMSSERVNANSIGSFIYSNHHKNPIDLNAYENFKRKNRNIFNYLESKNFIVRKNEESRKKGGKPDFCINEQFIVQCLDNNSLD